MRAANVLLVMLMAAAPLVLTAQDGRVIEFGITSGTAHHDSRGLYLGEDYVEQTLGLRADLRLIPTRIGVVGVALIFDQYRYNDAGFHCLPTGTNDLVCVRPRYALNAPWRVDRRGVGLSIQHTIPLGFSASLGVLAGATQRVYLGGSPPPPSVALSQAPTHEWFRGVDGGVSTRWRDLVFGVNGEYGRDPRSDYSSHPYYANASARVAYALPVPRRTRTPRR